MPGRARTVKCAGPSCKVRFTPKRSTAKFHAAACREAARRARQAETSGKPPAKKPAAKKTTAPKRTESEQTGTSAADSHELVVALRQELEEAKALDSFEGQLAIELARRLVKPDSQASALADKVRAARAAALQLAGAKPDAGEPVSPNEPEDDEVTRARNQREEARKAAGLA